MFKEKNFEYLENDYFEIISVAYNEKAKALDKDKPVFVYCMS